MSILPVSHNASRVEVVTVDDAAGATFTKEELACAARSPNKVVTTCPPSLGYVSTILIIVNRMVGTYKLNET